MTLREELFQSLDSSEEYRHAFAEEKIRTGLAAQLKTIRERLPHPEGIERPMTQAEFAKYLGKSQSWVSRLEDPNEPIPTVATLLFVASKLDIGLKVCYVPFSELLDDITALSEDKLYVPNFRQDRRLFPRKGPTAEINPGYPLMAKKGPLPGKILSMPQPMLTVDQDFVEMRIADVG